ncbi:hypothetical protein 162313511 [Organic Lake phycodnavirus 1]|nr:hypothetical protein 162313511 [Organic Lake phycodnavirus 1]
MIILYTLGLLLCIHFMLYYLNMDILQYFTKEVPDVEENIAELSESLLLLKDKNKSYI